MLFRISLGTQLRAGHQDIVAIWLVRLANSSRSRRAARDHFPAPAETGLRATRIPRMSSAGCLDGPLHRNHQRSSPIMRPDRDGSAPLPASIRERAR